MKKDIHKLADYLEKVTREGLAIEKKVLEWKQTETKEESPVLVSKAS